jgi:DNA-binding transcriptional ArsR family regulator
MRASPTRGRSSPWKRRRLAFRWHPFAIEPGVDYSAEPTACCCASSSPDSTPSLPTGVRRRLTPTAGAGPSRPNWWVSRPEREDVSASAVAAKAPLFDALGDPNRLRIITRLCDDGPCSTSEFTQVIPVSRQAATKHLLLLEAEGLVSSHREGRERIWRVRPEPLTDASDYLTGLSKRWDRVMEWLRAFVEDPA